MIVNNIEKLTFHSHYLIFLNKF